MKNLNALTRKSLLKDRLSLGSKGKCVGTFILVRTQTCMWTLRVLARNVFVCLISFFTSQSTIVSVMSGRVFLG